MSNHLSPDGLNTSPTYNEGTGWEGIVADELSKAGFQIVSRNFKLGMKEADIIALEGDTLCVIEVKARQNPGTLEDVEFLIDKDKRHNMAAIGTYFAKAHRDLGFRRLRFDFALVLIPDIGLEPLIRYYRNAFLPTVGQTF